MAQHTFHFLAARRRVGQLHLTTTVAAPAAVGSWLRAATAAAWPHIAAFRTPGWHVGVRLTGAVAARQANQQFRSKSYTPDVLSFPLWEAGYAGDVLLCWPTLQRAARAQGKPLQAHVQHLMIHALLHLGGADHTTPATAKRMEAQEISILATLGWPNPYLIG